MENNTTIKHQTYSCKSGHAQHVGDIPNNHCDDCFNVFFFSHAEFTKALDDVMFEENGEQIIEAIKGTKTLKQYKRFRATHQLTRVNVEKEAQGTTAQLEQVLEDIS